MDYLRTYPSFKEDIVETFIDIINGHKFTLIKINEGCFELDNGNCVLRFTFDRGEISCNIKRPADVKEIGEPIHVILSYVNPSADSNLKTDAVYDFKLQLQSYASVLTTYLENLLRGDFRWEEGYRFAKSRIEKRISFIREHFETEHPIKQRFLNGDISWEAELEMYLKEARIQI